MKNLLASAIASLALAGSVMAGRPIILDETQACSGAELVVIATISGATDIPDDDPFGPPGWRSLGFTKSAKVNVERTLLGTAPHELRIYGGKAAGGTDYRIEEGRYLVLLTRVKDNAYRAVDSHYSFAPIKDGKVGWLIERYPEKRAWIFPAEVLQRINAAKGTSEKTAYPP